MLTKYDYIFSNYDCKKQRIPNVDILWFFSSSVVRKGCLECVKQMQGWKTPSPDSPVTIQLRWTCVALQLVHWAVATVLAEYHQTYSVLDPCYHTGTITTVTYWTILSQFYLQQLTGLTDWRICANKHYLWSRTVV